jgi:hypothetical protein
MLDMASPFRERASGAPRGRAAGLVLALCLLFAVTTTSAQPLAPEDWSEVPAPSLRPRIVVSAPSLEQMAVPAETRRNAARLLAKLGGDKLTAADLGTARALAARHPSEDLLQRLPEALLLDIALQEAAARRFEAALDYLDQASANANPLLLARASLAVLVGKGDWPAAESLARDLVARDATNSEGQQALAYSLLRQGRGEEAREALREALAEGEDATLRLMLSRIERTLRQERGTVAESLSHFNLRYDGERHQAVGSRILELLEDHYWRLAATFDHHPEGPIPVVLLSRKGYLEATGAPEWSGGEYNSFDGHVRVPIEGLGPENVKQIERTLEHELTHVFVADLAGGAVPREIQEGLAQYVEGKRCSPVVSRLGAAGTEAAKVREHYRLALCFVEFLLDHRGQAEMNAVLRRTGELRDFRKAYAEIFEADYDAAKKTWQDTENPDVGDAP